MGYFSEMGIGCRKDTLEGNMWYHKAADNGDERAKQRLASFRALISGGTAIGVAAPRSDQINESGKKDKKECVVM